MNLRRSSRRRGVILSDQGWEKLQKARHKSEALENLGTRYTLKELSDRAGLVPRTVARVLNREVGVDKQTLEYLFRAFKLELCESDYLESKSNFEQLNNVSKDTYQDWGESIDVSIFYGRTKELAQLERWILKEHCRLVAVLGMGGIGKTSLSIRCAKQIQDNFDYIIWRSLQDAPSIKAILADIIQFLSNEQETETTLPESLGERISRLIDYLRSSCCLLILDNLEAILCSGNRAGQYLEGYEGYGELIRRVGETTHQSCLLLTSREKPKQVALLEGKALPVRSLQLSGLTEVEGQEILKIKGLPSSEDELRLLVERYTGNPLALKIVATMIQAVFDNDIVQFLQQGTVVFGDIQDLLEEQFERLSELEQEILYWLAINRETVSLSQLQADFIFPVLPPKLLNALESLRRRSLIEQSATSFTLQPVVIEYITQRLIQKVCEEVTTGQIILFKRLALSKAQAKDYVRETQIRLILKPVIDELFAIFNSKTSIEHQLTQILATQQKHSPLELGYVTGNIINLFCQLKTDLTGYDFSNLTIWQADLRNVKLHNTSFARADLSKSVFSEIFGSILSVAFSPNGKLLAIGDTSGTVRLYQVADGRQLFTHKEQIGWCWSVAFSPDNSIVASVSNDKIVRIWDVRTSQCLKTLQGHTSTVRSIAFSPHGRILVSGSDDHTVKLWDVSDGRCLKTLHGHTNRVLAVALCPNNQVLASGSHDRTVKLWDVSDGKCLKSFQGHSSRVFSVAFSSDGQLLASGSDDRTVKLWDVLEGKCIKTLQAQNDAVWSVTFSPQGKIIASGSDDRTVKLWDILDGKCLKTLQGHITGVWTIAFSPDGHAIASGSEDHTVRLWNVSDGKCIKTLQGYSNGVLSVAFNHASLVEESSHLLASQGTMLASGGEDHTIRLWDVSSGECLKTFQGHSNNVNSVTFSPDSRMLVSSSDDYTIKLWNVLDGKCFRTLQGHNNGVWSAVFSRDGRAIASSGDDCMVKLWDISDGSCLKTLPGHSNRVFSVVFSPDGRVLASSSDDHTVKLWDVKTQECFNTLQGHSNRVFSVVFSPDGRVLASSSDDYTVKLWNVSDGKCIKTLLGHTGWVRTVAFSSDGQLVASGSDDHTLKVWDVTNGECIKTLQGHTDGIRSVTFSSNGLKIASGSYDQTIKLWDVLTGSCVQILKSKRLYEGMNITDIIGLTEATIASLKALGAVEIS